MTQTRASSPRADSCRVAEPDPVEQEATNSEVTFTILAEPTSAVYPPPTGTVA